MGGSRVREPWEDGPALGSPSRSWTCGARPAHLPGRRGAEAQARPREVSAGTGSCGCAAAGARISGTRRRLWPRKDSPTPAREPPRPGDDRAREAAGGARAHLRPANGPRVCVHHGGVLPCAPRVPVVPGISVRHGGVPPCPPPRPHGPPDLCVPRWGRALRLSCPRGLPKGLSAPGCLCPSRPPCSPREPQTLYSSPAVARPLPPAPAEAERAPARGAEVRGPDSPSSWVPASGSECVT